MQNTLDFPDRPFRHTVSGRIVWTDGTPILAKGFRRPRIRDRRDVRSGQIRYWPSALARVAAPGQSAGSRRRARVPAAGSGVERVPGSERFQPLSEGVPSAEPGFLREPSAAATGIRGAGRPDVRRSSATGGGDRLCRQSETEDAVRRRRRRGVCRSTVFIFKTLLEYYEIHCTFIINKS